MSRVEKETGTAVPSLAKITANPIPDVTGVDRRVDLALDLSSSCVGWAVGHDRKDLHMYGKFIFKTTAGTGKKLIALEDFVEHLLTIFRPGRLLVEKTLSRRGQTTLRHAEILGIVRKVWAEYSGGEILDAWVISPITVKNTMKVKHGKDHTENKQIMVDKVNSLYNLRLRFDRNSKIKSDDDSADAIAVLTTVWRKGSRG